MTGLKKMGMVLVTGASGFIGPSLRRRLKADGWWVRAAMRQPAVGPWDETVTLDLGTPFRPTS